MDKKEMTALEVVCGHCCSHCVYSRGVYSTECNQVDGKHADACRREHAEGNATCQTFNED